LPIDKTVFSKQQAPMLKVYSKIIKKLR